MRKINHQGPILDIHAFLNQSRISWVIANVQKVVQSSPALRYVLEKFSFITFINVAKRTHKYFTITETTAQADLPLLQNRAFSKEEKNFRIIFNRKHIKWRFWRIFHVLKVSFLP